jgi:hypothetical protein
MKNVLGLEKCPMESKILPGGEAPFYLHDKSKLPYSKCKLG